MRITAYGIVLFFVCLNISLYLINESNVLPYWEQSPYEEPEGIMGRLVHLDLSATNLIIGATALSVAIILGFIAGHLIFGGTVGVILFGFDLMFPVIKWVVFGLPVFLAQFGVPLIVYSSLTALMSVVWFWFLLGFISQRNLEE